MDPAFWLVCVAAGTTLGLTALLPGFHVNTLVALAFAASWTGPGTAVIFVSAAVAHAFFGVLPQTYVGVPGDDAALSVLPAQRMVREGRGPEAVQIGLDAVLLATLAVVPLLLPAKWLLAEPGRFGEVLDQGLPWILLGAMIFLALGERKKGWRLVGWAIVVQVAAGAVGAFASAIPMQGAVALPAAQLLPLFAGLFGVAGLIASLLTSQAIPQQVAPRGGARLPRAVSFATLRGVFAALCTVAVPGLTPGVSASLAYGRAGDDPRRAIAALSATGAAHQLFAIGLLFVTLQSRTGLTAGLSGLGTVSQWHAGRPPAQFVDLMLAAILASLIAWYATRRLDRPATRLLARLPHRAPEWVALMLVVALVATLTGVPGLVLLGVAGTVGLVPIALGTRRVHLVACVALPLLAARWGLTH